MRQDEAFIQHFEVPKRSTISNAFLDAIRRDKARDAREVVDNVLNQAVEWLRWPDKRQRGELTIALIGEFEAEALAYADGKFAYLALSDEERADVKDGKAKEHMEAWMEKQPPTEKQLAVLRAKGYSGDALPTNRLAAKRLLDVLLSPKQEAAR